MIYYEFDKSINSSGYLFVFWLLQILCTTALVYTSLNLLETYDYHSRDTLRDAILFSEFTLIAAEFILHFISDNKCLSEQNIYGDSQPDIGTEWLNTGGIPKAENPQQNNQNQTGTRARSASNSSLTQGISGVRRLLPSPEMLSSFVGRITFTWITW